MKNEANEPAFPALDEVMNISGPTVDIEQFGATANDETDDTAAIQAALDHLEQNGGTLTFESDGVYSINGGLLLEGAEDFRIDGNGATIAVADGAAIEEGAALRIDDSGHFAVTDLDIDTGLAAGADPADTDPAGTAEDGDAADDDGVAEEDGLADEGQEGESSADDSSLAGLEITNGEDFLLDDVASVGFENIGGPPVNLSVLGTAAADDAVASNDELGAEADGTAEDGGASTETETQTQAQTGIAASEAAGDDAADDVAAAEDATAEDAAAEDVGEDGGGEDDAALQSAGAALNGETAKDGLDFGAVTAEGGTEQPDPVEEQSILESMNGDGATAGDDAAVASPDTAGSGQDDLSLLGVNPGSQTQDLGDFATS